eukprot:COSAG06_NODE_4499_length_4201_cov_6.056070_4_plen_90_part_00
MSAVAGANAAVSKNMVIAQPAQDSTSGARARRVSRLARGLNLRGTSSATWEKGVLSIIYRGGGARRRDGAQRQAAARVGGLVTDWRARA